MNKVKILLKSSVMALAYATITTNPLVQSLLLVESICAEDFFNVEKFGRDREIVNHFVDRSIKCSGAKWALEAIESPNAKFSESMKLLKDFIAIANKDRMDAIHCDKKSDITAIDDRHKVRISKLSDSVNAILREDSENKEHAEMEITKWQETSAGKKVLGLLNSIMVNETLNIINAELKEGMEYDKLKEFINRESHPGLSKDTTDNEKSLYDWVYEKVYWSISNCSVQQADGSWFHTHRSYHCYRDKLLRHFDPAGGTSGEKISSDRHQLMDRNFKNYLYHDFRCYLKQIGIIYNLEVADRNKGNKTVEPAYKQIAEMSDIINELCSDEKLISSIKSDLETNGVDNKYHAEVLGMLPAYLKSRVPNVHERCQSKADKKTWLMSEAKEYFMSSHDIVNLIYSLPQQNDINDKTVKTDQSQNQIVNGMKNVGYDINGIYSNKNVHNRENNNVKNDRQQENETNIIYNNSANKINKNVENNTNLEKEIDANIEGFMEDINTLNSEVRTAVVMEWRKRKEDLNLHELTFLFKRLPVFLRDYARENLDEYNKEQDKNIFFGRAAMEPFCKWDDLWKGYTDEKDKMHSKSPSVNSGKNEPQGNNHKIESQANANKIKDEKANEDNKKKIISNKNLQRKEPVVEVNKKNEKTYTEVRPVMTTKNVGQVQKNLIVAQSVERIVDNFTNAIEKDTKIRSSIEEGWKVNGQDVHYYKAMFNQLPQFLKNHLRETNRLQRFNSTPDKTKFLIGLAITDFLEYFNKLQSDASKTIKKEDNKTINTKNNDINDNINNEKGEHGPVLNNEILTNKIVRINTNNGINERNVDEQIKLPAKNTLDEKDAQYEKLCEQYWNQYEKCQLFTREELMKQIKAVNGDETEIKKWIFEDMWYQKLYDYFVQEFDLDEEKLEELKDKIKSEKGNERGVGQWLCDTYFEGVEYGCSLNAYNPSIRAREQIANKKNDSDKNKRLDNVTTKDNNATNIKNIKKPEEKKPKEKSKDTNNKVNVIDGTKNVNTVAKKDAITERPIVSEDTVNNILQQITLDERNANENREFSLLHEVGEDTKKEIIRLGRGDIGKIKELETKINTVLGWIDDGIAIGGHEYKGTWVSLYIGKDVVVKKILEKDLGFYESENGLDWLFDKSQKLVNDWQKNVGEQEMKLNDSKISGKKEKSKAIKGLDIESVVENIFQELETLYGIASMIDEDRARAKIKELKYNKEKIEKWAYKYSGEYGAADDKNEPNKNNGYKTENQEPDDQSVKNVNENEEVNQIYDELDNEQNENNKYNHETQKPVDQNTENIADSDAVEKIYQELEDEYGISGFIEEEAAKEQIRKLKCNSAAIIEWIENDLINGQ